MTKKATTPPAPPKTADAGRKPSTITAPRGQCEYCDARRDYYAEHMQTRRNQAKKDGTDPAGDPAEEQHPEPEESHANAG